MRAKQPAIELESTYNPGRGEKGSVFLLFLLWRKGFAPILASAFSQLIRRCTNVNEIHEYTYALCRVVFSMSKRRLSLSAKQTKNYVNCYSFSGIICYLAPETACFLMVYRRSNIEY